MLFGLCRLMEWSHCIFCVPNRLVFFFASLAFEVISFNACISAMEKTVRWTQALVLLRHLPGGLRTNSSCSQLLARIHQVFVMLQTKTRPHLFTTLSMRLPSSIGGDIQCIHQCLHLDCKPLVIYEGRGFDGETM